MSGIETRATESMSQTMRAVFAAIPLVFGAPEAKASDADRELATIARLGPACTALVENLADGDVASCKQELTDTALRLKKFAAEGSFSRTDLLAGDISNTALCERAVLILDEQREKIEEVVQYLSSLLTPDGGDVVATTLAPKAVAEIRSSKGSVDAGGYQAHVKAKLEGVRATLASCGFGLRAILSLGGRSKAQDEIQRKLPVLLDQIMQDISEPSDVQRLQGATVSLVHLLDILRSAAEGGVR